MPAATPARSKPTAIYKEAREALNEALHEFAARNELARVTIHVVRDPAGGDPQIRCHGLGAADGKEVVMPVGTKSVGGTESPLVAPINQVLAAKPEMDGFSVWISDRWVGTADEKHRSQRISMRWLHRDLSPGMVPVEGDVTIGSHTTPEPPHASLSREAIASLWDGRDEIVDAARRTAAPGMSDETSAAVRAEIEQGHSRLERHPDATPSEADIILRDTLTRLGFAAETATLPGGGSGGVRITAVPDRPEYVVSVLKTLAPQIQNTSFSMEMGSGRVEIEIKDGKMVGDPLAPPPAPAPAPTPGDPRVVDRIISRLTPEQAAELRALGPAAAAATLTGDVARQILANYTDVLGSDGAVEVLIPTGPGAVTRLRAAEHDGRTALYFGDQVIYHTTLEGEAAVSPSRDAMNRFLTAAENGALLLGLDAARHEVRRKAAEHSAPGTPTPDAGGPGKAGSARRSPATGGAAERAPRSTPSAPDASVAGVS